MNWQGLWWCLKVAVLCLYMMFTQNLLITIKYCFMQHAVSWIYFDVSLRHVAYYFKFKCWNRCYTRLSLSVLIHSYEKKIKKGVSDTSCMLCLFIATPLLHVYMKSQNPAVTVRQNIEDKLQFRNAVPCLMVERVIYCGIQYSLLCFVEIGVAAYMCGYLVFVLVTWEFICGKIGIY